jgi:3'-phosphoadenosine 5'-phosphosulfate sulfotransferase (PAPS reductase)/FAD synthetase
MNNVINKLIKMLKPEVLARIKSLIERKAMFFVNHSGGKDSQLMAILVRSLVPTGQIVYVHADLGDVEWPGTQDHIREYLGGHELNVVHSIFKNGDDKDLISMFVANMNFPSKGQRFCTSDGKRGPIQKFIKGTGHKLIVNCMGLRGGESDDREMGLDKDHFEKTGEALTFLLDEKNSIAGREWYDWLPIFDVPTDSVIQMIGQAGEEVHWAYAAGMSRLSCSFCVFGNNGDLAIAAKRRTQLYARYVALEKFLGKTIKAPKKSKKLGEDVSLQAVTGVKADPALVEKEVAQLAALRKSLVARDLHRKARKEKAVA